MRDGEAADGEAGDDVILELEEGVALGPMEDGLARQKEGCGERPRN